ncbi:ABC transporter permease subunit [Hymenobacter sp. YC55]|uniref:ABC transporter permease n=1 Tax=Hymenobacter sp. YC55 TaxID=3034019 RepID=UPI0023F787F0|nr:ABC transporter permease subunit [Hymenobacter sp. YC55]
MLRFPFMQRLVAVPLDWLMQAAIALLAAIPRLLLILTVAAAFEVTSVSLVLLLGCTSWTQSGRLVRAEVRRVQQLSYFEAARAAGLPTWHLMRYHLLPNILRPIMTTLPLSIAAFIVLETTLSFLGVGLPAETPSWGRLLALSRFASSSWWLFVFPILCLLATTLSLRQLLLINKR